MQNNNWGDDTTQCIDVNQRARLHRHHRQPQQGRPTAPRAPTRRSTTAATTPTAAPAAGLPMQASAAAFAGIRDLRLDDATRAAASRTRPTTSGSTRRPRTDGQNTGAEIMVWLNHTGLDPAGRLARSARPPSPAPPGTCGTATSAGTSSPTSASQTTTSMSFTVNDFFTDAINRGYAQRVVVPHQHPGRLRAVGRPDRSRRELVLGDHRRWRRRRRHPGTVAPGAPRRVRASPPRRSTCRGRASTRQRRRDRLRHAAARPAHRAAPSPRSAPPPAPSFTNTGLTASTTYRYQVRARDAAGNTSAVSSPVTVTTSAGGGGGGACSAALPGDQRLVGRLPGRGRGHQPQHRHPQRLDGHPDHPPYDHDHPDVGRHLHASRATRVTIKPLSYTATRRPTPPSRSASSPT